MDNPFTWPTFEQTYDILCSAVELAEANYYESEEELDLMFYSTAVAEFNQFTCASMN